MTFATAALWCIPVILSLIIPLALGVRHKRYYTFFVALLLFYSLLVPVNIPNQFEGIGQFGLYFLIISNLLFSFWIGVFEFANRGRTLHVHPGSKSISIALLCAFGFAFFAIIFLTGGISTIGVFDRRDLEVHSPLELPLPYLAILVCACWGTLRTRWQMLLLPVLLIMFLNTGGRVEFAGALAFAAYRVFRYLKVRWLVLLTPFAILGAGLFYYALRIVRSVGLAQLTDLAALRLALNDNLVEQHGGENVIARAYLFALSLVTNGEWIPSGDTLKRLLFLFVPRTWGMENIKPDDVTYPLWDLAVQHNFFAGHPYADALRQLYEGGGTGSLHPIIWGEGFLNLGLWSLAIWPLAAAWLLTRWDRYTMRSHVTMDPRVLLGVMAPSYIYFVRGSVSIAITYLAVIIIILWLSTKAVRSFQFLCDWSEAKANVEEQPQAILEQSSRLS